MGAITDFWEKNDIQKLQVVIDKKVDKSLYTKFDDTERKKKRTKKK